MIKPENESPPADSSSSLCICPRYSSAQVLPLRSPSSPIKPACLSQVRGAYSQSQALLCSSLACRLITLAFSS